MALENFENLLHAKWFSFAMHKRSSTKFAGMLGEDKKIIWEKIC